MTGRAETGGLHPPGPGFCEIGCASNFSFLRGASKPDELVVTAKLIGLGGIGIADRNTLAGVVRGYQQARDEAFPYRPGARLVFADETPDIFAYPRTRAGWGNLCRLLSFGNRQTVKGNCVLHLEDLLERGDEINLALLAPDRLGSAGPDHEAAQDRTRNALNLLREAFPRKVRLGVALRHDGLDQRRLFRAARLAAQCRTPLLATNDAAYHAAERRRLQDVVTAIREHVPITEAGFLLARNAERHLKSTEEMQRLFRHRDEALAESHRFFSELAFDLKSLKYEYPDESLHLDRPPPEALRHLALEGAKTRYPAGVPDKILTQIDHELAIIRKLEYEPYFLTVHAIMKAAKKMDILCQGRGSAANSTVCYCIGVTEVNPNLTALLFERFISPDRNEPPDIDIDFEHERREEVIQWIYERYGRDNAALAATVITYRARSAAREVGKAFGLTEDAVSALSGSVWGYSSSDLGEREARAAGLAPKDRTTRNVLSFAKELAGFPRHLSQHVGGFVITRGPIDEVVPVLNTGMKGRTIVEWDKDDLDEIGILKIDILALGMLTCLRKAFDLLGAHYGERPTLDTLSGDATDDATYKMTHRADTLGVFQIESRAQMSMLPKLRPNEFYDLVIQVAIVRPGPIQGDMVHPYLKRRMGIEDVTYPNPDLQAVLERTEGVPLFQEQAMQIAIVAAGFTPAEADRLRRAMATFKRSGTIQTFKEKMINGMIANDYKKDFAERCFKQIEGFGEYGFPESHAASFALLVYASCYLKCHYPDVFAAALLNAQPMGFYAPAQIVRDAREHGVEVLAVDVNHSDWDCTLEERVFDPDRIAARHAEMRGEIKTKRALRLGFRQVKGLSEDDMTILVTARGEGGRYDSVRDLWLRSGLKRAAIERLADADAFASIGLSRRDALWAAKALDPNGAAERLPLFESSTTQDLQKEPDARLPPMPLGEEVINDYRFLHLSLKAHPVSFVRRRLESDAVLSNQAMETLPSGRRVTVSGLVLVRQRPGSAKGVIFMTIEDETGIANIIVWPKVFEALRPIVLGARFVKIIGKMQSDRGVIHVVAERIVDLTGLLMEVAAGESGSSGSVASADHAWNPLNAHRDGRRHRGKSRSPAISAENSLGAMLARADEVRRPIDEGRLHRNRLDEFRRIAAVVREGANRNDPQAIEHVPPTKAVRAVLPKGRNFQ